MSTGKADFLDFLDTACDFQEHFCLSDSLYAHPGNVEPPDSNERKYGRLLAAEEVVRAGDIERAMCQVVRANTFHLFHSYRLVMCCWLVFSC